MVPFFGERTTIRIGLVGFAIQCVMIGLAEEPSTIWASIFFALFSNLVRGTGHDADHHPDPDHHPDADHHPDHHPRSNSCP